MPRWNSGWLRARVPGGGERLYWRGNIQLTLSEDEALKWRAEADRQGVPPDQILRAALIDWLQRLANQDHVTPPKPIGESFIRTSPGSPPTNYPRGAISS